MKDLKNLMATVTLMAVFMISATNAKAGLLVSDFTGGTPHPCTATEEVKPNNGILVTFTGILVTFTGILVTFSDSEDSQTNCGILMTD